MLPARCNTIICQHNYFQRKYFQRKYCQHKYLTPSLKLNIFAIVKEMRSSLMLPLHTAQVSNVVKQLFQTQLFPTQISYNFFKAIYFCNCSGNEQLFDAHCTLHRFPTLQHNYFKRKYFQRKYLTASLKPNIFATVEEMSSSLMLPARCNTIICQHNFFSTQIFSTQIFPTQIFSTQIFAVQYFQCKYFQSKYLTISLKPNIFATVEEMSVPLIQPTQVSNVATQLFVDTIILNAKIFNRIMFNKIFFSFKTHI